MCSAKSRRYPSARSPGCGSLSIEDRIKFTTNFTPGGLAHFRETRPEKLLRSDERIGARKGVGGRRNNAALKQWQSCWGNSNEGACLIANSQTTHGGKVKTSLSPCAPRVPPYLPAARLTPRLDTSRPMDRGVAAVAPPASSRAKLAGLLLFVGLLGFLGFLLSLVRLLFHFVGLGFRLVGLLFGRGSLLLSRVRFLFGLGRFLLSRIRFLLSRIGLLLRLLRLLLGRVRFLFGLDRFLLSRVRLLFGLGRFLLMRVRLLFGLGRFLLSRIRFLLSRIGLLLRLLRLLLGLLHLLILAGICTLRQHFDRKHEQPESHENAQNSKPHSPILLVFWWTQDLNLRPEFTT